MATYNNQHWLLSHIRNSFISTDDTGLCETVMLSDDLPKQFILRCQKRNENIEYVCYPGLDQSDDEDIDLATQSFDIQMYPEIGSHRYRSNTAQKLEKMDLARRKAARIKNVKVEDVLPSQSAIPIPSLISSAAQNNVGDDDKFFIKKNVNVNEVEEQNTQISLLADQLLKCPKQPQNKFLQYARFDGTSQTGIVTKNLYIFLNMLPENQRNYPIKICVAASAKIQEVIGFVCYKCSMLNPDTLLQSVRHYGLYITEDNGEMDTDFPPLDLREPCSKFGFKYLTLAEKRPSAHITKVEYRSFSMTSENEAAGDAAVADTRGGANSNGNNNSGNVTGGMGNIGRGFFSTIGGNISGYNQREQSDDMARMMGHNLMIEAPLYRTYRLNIVVNGFFKVEVQLGISGERIEIDPVQKKNSKFWKLQKAISYNIESLAYCEIISQKGLKAVFRIWYINTPSNMVGVFYGGGCNELQFYSRSSGAGGNSGVSGSALTSSSSPQHYSLNGPQNTFKHSDFETDINTAQQILAKVNFLLEVRSSVIRREFLISREKKNERKK